MKGGRRVTTQEGGFSGGRLVLWGRRRWCGRDPEEAPAPPDLVYNLNGREKDPVCVGCEGCVTSAARAENQTREMKAAETMMATAQEGSWSPDSRGVGKAARNKTFYSHTFEQFIWLAHPSTSSCSLGGTQRAVSWRDTARNRESVQ